MRFCDGSVIQSVECQRFKIIRRRDLCLLAQLFITRCTRKRAAYNGSGELVDLLRAHPLGSPNTISGNTRLTLKRRSRSVFVFDLCS